MHYTTLNTPLGALLIVASDTGLTRINFQDAEGAVSPPSDATRSDRALQSARTQLREYFDGKRQQFDLPLAPHGTTFQQTVWRQLQAIPYGATATYGEVANAIGKPTASRAVGAANGRNPLPVIVPCHRVIGSTGKLTGYYGGLHIKEHLLALEEHRLC